ncbi:MAG TPA: methyltransferase domain-containing protein [Ktedonobacterales bacterium]|nr:methyltransferase domain-containing protein [Ktedonobacterales bacterium]
MGTNNVGSLQWKQEAGRRRREQGYGFTNDAQECARLTLQHHLMKLAWHDHYWAPIHAPEEILDVACGTSIWGYELLQQFPQAHLTALDIDHVLSRRFLEKEQAKAYIPLLQRLTFIEADAREPLPFQTFRFDFTHARLPEFLSDEQWPAFIRELMRVTRPSGFVEVVTVGFCQTGNKSQALRALLVAAMQDAHMHGEITLGGLRLTDHLRAAGISANIATRVVGQTKQQQRMLLRDIVHAFCEFKLSLARRGIMAEDEFERQLAQFRKDALETGFSQPFYRVWFQPKDQA